MSRYQHQRASDPARANIIPWPPLLLVIAIAGAYLMGRVRPLDWPGLDDFPARLVGLAFGLAGVILIAWGVATLRQHDTTVRPDQGATALATTGPFRRLRNPIYLGDTLVILGLAEITKNFWFVAAAVLFAVLVTWLQIIPEERHLEATFGNDYRDYKQRTRRWI